MAGQTDAHTPGRPDAGWLLTHVDGLIVAADEASAHLLRATSRDALVGRSWPSLVATPDRSIATAALEASRGGAPWSGDLRFVFGLDATPLHVEVTPTGGDPPMLVVRLAPPARAEPVPSFEEQRDTAALVVALDAEGALNDDAAAAYAVLQALARVVRFEWAAVLRFDGAEAAQVVGAFPTPMGGVGPGTVWTPLDPAEGALVTRREPRLDVEVGRAPGSPSPLERLPAFGLTSRLLIPLFEGAVVVGAVACYAPSHAPFRPIDGLRVERFARRLGQRLGQRLPRPGSQPGRTASTPPPESAGNPLEGAPASLDEVVAEVAHQLNNPLTSILGYAQLLPTLPEEDRAAALATIEQEAERAARMVRNLLAFGREQPAVEAQPPSPAVRLLIVASDGPLVSLATEVLTRGGYAVGVVPSAEGAREQTRSGAYAAVLLDAALDPSGQLAATIEAEAPALAGRIVLVVPDTGALPATQRPAVTRGRLSAELLSVLANLGR